MATKKTTASAAKVEEAVEVKEETKKASAKKPAAKKAETVKEEAVEVKEEKKAPAKKSAAKKTVSTSVVLQFNGQEVTMDAVVENAKKAFEAEGNKVSGIKDIQVYVKPEEYAAYYVIDGVTGRIDLF